MILFFYGEEPFRQAQKVAQLTASFLEKNPTGGGYLLCDFTQTASIEDVRQAIITQNLFTQKKLVIIKDLFGHTTAHHQREVKELLEGNASDDVIIFWENSQPRKNATLFTWLIKNADKAVAYEPLDGQRLSRWIGAYAQSNGTTISAAAVQMLITYVGNHLQPLSQEISKLSLYARGREITTADVAMLVRRRIEGDIFDTIALLAETDRAKALAGFKKQLQSGDAPQKILAMYAYQLRTLLSVADAVVHGMSDKGEIARTIKVHPFAVQKALAITRRIDRKRLLRAHTTLTKIDQDTKTGAQEITTALEMFIVHF